MEKKSKPVQYGRKTKSTKKLETCARCGEKYKDIGRGGSLCENCEKYYAQDRDK